MSHKLHGDVPLEHIKMAEELVELEGVLDLKGTLLPSDKLAKGYVCLACDWYSLNEEDTGKILLDKAEKVCPNYFSAKLEAHMNEDENYSLLIKSLSSNLMVLFKDALRRVEE